MWIFTRDGYYSAVQHNADPSLIQVRARAYEDLERLQKAVPFEGDAILTTLDADYRYRANVLRDDFAHYVLESVLDIDYVTSVKDVISRGEPRRKKAMMEIWTAMYDFQADAPDPEEEIEVDEPAVDAEWEEPEEARQHRAVARQKARERLKAVHPHTQSHPGTN